MIRVAGLCCVIAALLPAHARGEPPREYDPSEPARAPITGEALDRAPAPATAGGHAVPPRAPSAPSQLERAARAIPRAATHLLLAPIRGVLWLDDRFQGRESGVSGELDIAPTAAWDGSYGISGGARIEHRDLRGATGELLVMVGTRDRIIVGATLSSGDRLGPITVFAGGGYRHVVDASFFGYGDSDKLDGDQAAPMGVDPAATPIAVDTRFALRERLVRAGIAARLAATVAVSATGSLRRLTFDAPDPLIGDPYEIGEVFDVAMLPGFLDGVEAARATAMLSIDRLRTRDRLQSRAVPSTGWAAVAYAGWQEGLAGDPTGFGFGGLDATGYLDLYRGDRTLMLRLTIDGVVGELDDIPFVELPALGGAYHLRGYTWGRFRDRWAAAATVEYGWPVTPGFAGFVFVDAGRVARELADITAELPRASLGVGLQVHDLDRQTLRAWVATTDDAGVMAFVGFEPAFGHRARSRSR